MTISVIYCNWHYQARGGRNNIITYMPVNEWYARYFLWLASFAFNRSIAQKYDGLDTDNGNNEPTETNHTAVPLNVLTFVINGWWKWETLSTCVKQSRLRYH